MLSGVGFTDPNSLKKDTTMYNITVIQGRLGDRLRAFRKQRGLTQAEMAKLAEVNKNDLGEIERGVRNISIRVLVKLAWALEVPPVALIED
jgi:transcriptional regulator with XRE-family HTH domain